MGVDTRFIGGTKGSHLIIDNPTLFEALNGHEFFFENDDGRIVLLLPYMGKVMAGTTDIRIDNPDEARLTEEEKQYILDLIPKVFPNIPVDTSQIVFHFSGVRPLAASEAGYTGNVTRDHTIRSVEPAKSGFAFPIHSLIGGKWTSFRAFGEHTTDHVLKDLGIARKASTAHMAIGGGRGYPTDEDGQKIWVKKLAESTDISAERAQQLFERYGTHAEAIAQYCADGDDAPLQHHAGYTRREIIYLIHSEQVTRVADIPLRRTLIGWLGELTDALLLELNEICAEELGWSPEQRDKELLVAVDELNDHHGTQLQKPMMA